VEDKISVFKNCANINKELKVSVVEDLNKNELIERKKLVPELIKAKAMGMTAYFRRAKLIIKKKIVRSNPPVEEIEQNPILYEHETPKLDVNAKQEEAIKADTLEISSY